MPCLIARLQPPVEQQVVERRMLVDRCQPVKHSGQRVLRHPDAKRLVEPETIAVALIETQATTDERDYA
jgi:hypothetical protein